MTSSNNNIHSSEENRGRIDVLQKSFINKKLPFEKRLIETLKKLPLNHRDVDTLEVRLNPNLENRNVNEVKEKIKNSILELERKGLLSKETKRIPMLTGKSKYKLGVVKYELWTYVGE